MIALQGQRTPVELLRPHCRCAPFLLLRLGALAKQRTHSAEAVGMHCGVMVTGYNQGDWGRLMAGEYDRPPAVPDHQQMDDTLYMGELVEPLGFDSIWATEHYGSAYSMQPNPLQWLAYWAGRTQRVDVGTAVIVAPWWNLVRLAHEISMLDILLKGSAVAADPPSWRGQAQSGSRG